MVQNAQNNDRRIDFIALKKHYEGVGLNAVEIVKYDKILQDSFYSGKKIHICGGTNSKDS